MPQPVEIPPMDAHNRALVSHVHPPAWTNPEPGEAPYDLVVVGAGTAGLITAIAAAGFGKRVALIERHLMGGDCLNVGCVPSKALLRSAAAAAAVRQAPDFGVTLPGHPTTDFGRVMERLRRLRASIAPHDGAQRYTEQGVHVYLGHASFTGRDRLEVGGATLRFRRACIATGARAARPAIPGLDAVDFLTNETLFELTDQPRRLGVIGAGAIGCEMAQAFARLGSEVVLFEARHGVLPNEDPDGAAVVRHALEADGVRVLCCGRDLRVAQAEGGGVRLCVDSHDQAHDVVVDRLLVATGRTPNVDGMGLEAAGVGNDRAGVRVDDHLRTTNRRIYAAGDVCSTFKFTHAADAAARIVVRNAVLGFLPFKPKASRLVVPWCTYTDPELAHVGRTPRDLDAAGERYQTVTIDMADIDRARLESETHGLLKVHVRRSGRILGATFVSRHAGESIGEITASMVHGIKLQQLARVIHPYPTQAEAIKRAADQYFRTWLLGWKDRLQFWR